MPRSRTCLLAALAASTMAVRPSWSQVPLGGAFQANTYTTGAQRDAAVASAADDGFVVLWESGLADGSQEGIFGRGYDWSGAPATPSEFQVNVYTTGVQGAPAVARSPAGPSLAVWHSVLDDPRGAEVVGRLYGADLLPQPDEIAVNVDTTGGQIQAAAAADSSGFVVTWSRPVHPAGEAILGRRFDLTGAPQAGEFRVSEYTGGPQRYPSVATDGGGNFVVAWSSVGEDGHQGGVFARRFDAVGTPLGAPFQVNVHTTGPQGQPAVASDEDGNFVVVWASWQEDGSGYGVWGRRYDSSGGPVGAPFQVNQHTTGGQYFPAVAMSGDGRFVVAWTSETQEGSGRGIFARVYEASGAPFLGEFHVNAYTTGDQFGPSLATGPGTFVVLWNSRGQDGDGLGVFGQRFVDDLVFRDGFDSGTLDAWSTASQDGGDLAPAVEAASKATPFGLRALVDDVTGVYVQDDAPRDEGRYRARFYFDANGFDPGEAQLHRRTRIFVAFEEAPARRLAAVVLRRVNGAYGLMARARLDDDTQVDTPFVPISDAPHVVEIDWRRASGPDTLDGSLHLWIDGSPVATADGLDNAGSAVDFVRLGALSVKGGASGTLFWDEFESRRGSSIGP